MIEQLGLLLIALGIGWIIVLGIIRFLLNYPILFFLSILIPPLFLVLILYFGVSADLQLKAMFTKKKDDTTNE